MRNSRAGSGLKSCSQHGSGVLTAQDNLLVKSDQKAVRIAPPSDEPVLMDHWQTLRRHLFWAYDRPIKVTGQDWDYIPWPASAWLIREGEVTLVFPEGEEVYRTGTWIFPRLAPGMQRFAPGSHLLSLRFKLEWPHGEHIFGRQKTLAIPEGEIPQLTRISSELAEFTAKHFPNRTDKQAYLHGTLGEYLKLQPLFTQWISTYYEILSAHEPPTHTYHYLSEKVRRVIQFLDDRSLAIPFHENELAAQTGLSVSHLHRIFVKEIGETPAAYWNKRRLAAAQSRLAGGSQSIKSIAYEMGFSTPENFSHWFRAHTAQSPKQYRDFHALTPKI